MVESNTRELVRKAFQILRKKGYFARMNFWCCQSCAWYAIPEELSKKVVFFHAQDNEDLNNKGHVFIAWAGNGQEIKDVFQSVCLNVVWSGAENQRFEVYA